MSKSLYRTIAVVWTDENADGWGIEQLAYEADTGCGVCIETITEVVEDYRDHPEWSDDLREFFFPDGESDDDEEE